MRKNFRTFNLAVEFYKMTAALRLSRHLRDQLLRASSSVALNLAEGGGRGSRDDQKHFFRIAFGSLRECQAILDLATPEKDPVVEHADKLAAHLYCLIRS